MMKDLYQEIDRRYKDIWSNRPNEIDNTFVRNAGNKKQFPVWLTCYCQIEELCGSAYKYVSYGEEQTADLKTVKSIASASMSAAAKFFLVYTGMNEFSSLLTSVAKGYEKCSSYEEFATLSKKIHLYACRMFYWIDAMIPWDKVSAAFSDIMHL